MYLKVFLKVLVLSVVFSSSSAHVIRLDRNLDLAPEVVGDDIVLSLVAKTTGYVALGISLTGAFQGSDIIVAWVDDITKIGHVKDAHAVKGLSELVEDATHNYKVLAASQNNTHTVIQLSRLPQTCDDVGDVDIVNDTMRVMWYLASEDPGRSSWKEIMWQGPRSVHLTAPPVRRPSALPHWDVLVPNFQLPEKTASFYFCKIYKIPQLDTKHHITGYVPLIEEDHEALIEHMILYACLGGTEFESYLEHPGTACRDSAQPPEWKSCYTPIVTWAAGSDGDHFPDHVGLPMSEGEGKATYFMLEVHYDNPAFQTVRDSSGVRVFYTPNLRQYDGSILVTGVTPSSLQIIPPKQKNFTSTGYCDNQCTNLMFPEDGIRIVSVAFHTHSTGRRVKLKKVREGKELDIIAKDDNFDPRYQQSRRLHQEAIILPGDEIITECVYSTINRTKITFGGYTVRDETCLAYVLYYPRAALSSCTSVTPTDFFFETFGIRKFYNNNMSDVEKLILKDSNKRVTGVAQHVPMQSLFFRFNEKNGFNLDRNFGTGKPSPSVLRAMAEIDNDNAEEETVLSTLVIYKPEEFQNRSFTDHLRELPWEDAEFTRSVEMILNRRKHQTFCRLQNSVPAMPISVYVFPNYSSSPEPPKNIICKPQTNNSIPAASASLRFLAITIIIQFRFT